MRFVLSLFILFLFSFFQSALARTNDIPHWVKDLPILKEQSYYIVVKGFYPTQAQAQSTEKLIKHLMGSTPADKWDSTDKYQGLPKGKFLVGMLFDSEVRAKWWMTFSYRNRKISKGQIFKVKIIEPSQLPYMPDPVRVGRKSLLTKEEALSRVQSLPDVKALAVRKKLLYKVTDYPRNGDLRYEIEILEKRKDQEHPIMIDFIMVSALNGQITERLSASFGKSISSIP